LLVVLTLVQEAAGLSSLQSGLLTVGYPVGVLATIRVGEKILQKSGPRKPMLPRLLDHRRGHFADQRSAGKRRRNHRHHGHGSQTR
jgi:hypothetical protein